MGQLVNYLQDEFARHCPSGWTCQCECRVLNSEFERWLGYSPRADVCLESKDATRRIWIEFEISRADPVANHAKFATAHLFQPFQTTDAFVSMVSSHVNRGRRNLASNAVHLLRRVGISAFQTVLLPSLSPDSIQSLNHSPLESLSDANLDAAGELARVMQLVDPVHLHREHRIHFVSELFDVVRNLSRWNQEVCHPDGAALWKRRTVTYFVFDPVAKLFAPAKFCAYSIPIRPGLMGNEASGLMDMQTYCELDESDPRFDGHRAQKHLTSNLGMIPTDPDDAPEINLAFTDWLSKRSTTITVHPTGPKFLVPPWWYR